MPANIAPGTIIDRYCIEHAIGAGSMGDVFRGQDVDLKRKVALKILSSRHRDNHELHQRFVREARSVAAISHPNVVQVFTTGNFDGRPYIAMEFLDGTDLGSLVQQHGPWPSLAAACAVREAALGLRAAARAGLIHRDVKPSNLVLLHDDTVKVTDFGLAKPVDPGDDPVLTTAGMVVGTPDYIAPEQARGELIDERVDLYALGGTLYFLLTGMPPFRTGNATEDNYMKVVSRHLRKPPPDARERVPSVDPDLSRLVQLMMVKQPGQRPSYDELVDELTGIIARLEAGDGAPEQLPVLHGSSLGGPMTSQPPAPAPAAAAASTSAAATWTIAPAPSKAAVPSALPRWVWLPTVFAVLVFLIGLVLELLGPRPTPPAAPSASPQAAAPAAPVAPPQATKPALPTPPEGMVLVTRADGSPWLFVDARPVSANAYQAATPAYQLPRQRAGTAPVIGVSYSAALTFAAMRNRRLLTAGEWDAAAQAPGFVSADGLWEWVIGEWQPGRAPVRSVHGASKRDPGGAGDTTFRMAMSPP